MTDEELAILLDTSTQWSPDTNDQPYRVIDEETVKRAATRLRELSSANRLALEIIIRETRVCPFGGGKNGQRTCCVFGHPGCACDDFVADMRERHVIP